MSLFDLDPDPSASEPRVLHIGPVQLGTAVLILAGVILASALGMRFAAPMERAIEQRPAFTEGPWRQLATLPAGTAGLAAATAGGRVYVLGSAEDIEQPHTSVRRYDPARDVWEDGPALPAYVRESQIVGIDQDLYVLGGNGFTGPSARAYVLDAQAGRWRELPRLPEPRAAGGAAMLDGIVYLVGGINGRGTVGTSWAFDPSRDSWREIAPLPTPRHHLAVATYEGMVCAAGGLGAVVKATIAFECYDPKRNAWVEMPALPVALTEAAAAAANGGFWLVGEEVFVYKDGWTAAPGLRQPRVGPALATTGDKMLAIGGRRRGGAATGAVEGFSLR